MNEELTGILFAITAAISWGGGTVFARLGMRHMTTMKGTLISLIAGLTFMAALALLLDFEAVKNLSLKAIGLLAVIGLLNFLVGRFCNYMSLERIGVGRSTPIMSSSPFFAAILAVIFLGESMSLSTLAGTALVLLGIYVTLIPPRRINAGH
jgi:drug/metabolite transporter (DMT)-like permease